MKTKSVRSERVRRDFALALERLQSGKRIRDVELRARAAAGVLRITCSSVAREAGHSRTLIGTRQAVFPEIRKAILACKSTSSGRRTESNRRGRLGYEIKLLRERYSLLASTHLALLRKNKSLELQVKSRDQIIARTAFRE